MLESVMRFLGVELKCICVNNMKKYREITLEYFNGLRNNIKSKKFLLSTRPGIVDVFPCTRKFKNTIKTFKRRF